MGFADEQKTYHVWRTVGRSLSQSRGSAFSGFPETRRLTPSFSRYKIESHRGPVTRDPRL
jgi:hypothetical protein